MEDSSHRSSKSERSYSQRGRGTKKIRGIVVNLPEPDEIPLNSESFLKMVNLEFFINRNAHFSGHVDYLPNSLRLIEFGGRSNIDQRYMYVPFNFHPRDHTYVLNLPSNFQPRDLVSFDVSYSGIRQLKGFKNLAKLTWMNLSGCESLEKIPDLSGSPNIKSLYLNGCKNLVEVNDSVGFLDKLEVLFLSGFSKLTRFATRLGLRSLKKLSLNGCARLERFPEIEKDKMKSLMHLNIGNSGIRELPSSIAYLVGLTYLLARGCELQNVPNLSGSPNIRVLDLRECTSLVEVDDSVGFLDKLEFLYLGRCSNLTRFATRLGLRSLKELSLDGCTRLERFPEIEKDKMKSMTHLNIGKSGIRELPSSIAYLVGLTYLWAHGCELRNVPDLSGSPNIRELDLSDCTSLVEVDDSVGFLDKLVVLDLRGCSKLTRFATRLGSRSLFSLSLRGCRRLESFPEIEGKMESLLFLDIEKSGIRELPSIAYFTRLKELKASGCELQNIQLLPFGKKVKFDEVSSLLSLDLEGCNLSESDFLVPLDCWSTLTVLNLSRNNFVSLPDCISKLVNLMTLFLSDCKRLREIPVLPPKLRELDLDGCTSLDKIPKLPPRLEALSLCNCSGLSGDEVAKLENNLLNAEIEWDGWDEYDPEFRFVLNIIYPGNEVSKWFSYTSNHPTTFQPIPEYESDEDDREGNFVGGSEYRFEIPLKLQVGETTLGLAISFVVEPGYSYGDVKFIVIHGKEAFAPHFWHRTDIKATHVRFALVNLKEQVQQGDICQVVFRFRKGCPIKSCGVHCLLRNLLHLSPRPTSSLGKRPRRRGSSDIFDDESDQQQQWLSSSSEPADDHPKRRQFYTSVPIDIEDEEDEEQEQPSDSNDPQFLIY